MIVLVDNILSLRNSAGRAERKPIPPLRSLIKGSWGGFKHFCLCSFIVLLAIPAGCDYARMKEQESLRPYEKAMPEMPAGIIPREGGLEMLKRAKPETLRNPFPYGPEQVNRGKDGFAYFCVMCHGPKADGSGTVGQSFYPLPANLNSPYVQDQSDGWLFFKISLGFRRHPPLANTVSQEDRWAIIHYLRSLVKRNQANGVQIFAGHEEKFFSSGKDPLFLNPENLRPSWSKMNL